MENKVCRKCNMDLPITDYKKPNKNGYYDYKCRRCYREEYRETKGAEVAERKRLKRAMLEEKGVKVCKGCNIELPLFKFLTNKSGYYYSYCKGCRYINEKKTKLKKRMESGYVSKNKLAIQSGVKICNKCNLELPISEFYIKNKDRGTYDCKCKKCTYNSRIEYSNRYRSIPENREKIRESARQSKKKKALENRLIKQKLKEDALTLLNIEKEKKSQELERKRLAKEERNRLAKEERDRINAYRKTDEYKVEQKNKDNERRKLRWKNKWENNELFAIKHRLRTLVRNSFRKKGYNRFESRTEEIVGISYNEFKVYMESKFVNGMSWENRGEWHIDHIIPLSAAKSQEELIALSHYTNLQPLWAMDNLKKGGKIISNEEAIEKLKEYSNSISKDKMEIILRRPRLNLKSNKEVKGYYYNKKDKKYITRIGVGGKKITIGRFNTPEEAAEAYQKAKLIYHI
jgi:hypothetical protein